MRPGILNAAYAPLGYDCSERNLPQAERRERYSPDPLLGNADARIRRH
jgi:hypothetical protein